MKRPVKKTTPVRHKSTPVSEPPPLAVGETWFVRLPQSATLACVLIDEMTEKTIVLILHADGGQGYDGRIGRYERAEIRFVERVP